MQRYLAPVSALSGGILFGIGLLLSGMSDPQRVQAFLDVFGEWDPTLALVMASALAVALPMIQLAARRRVALCGAPMALPPRRQTDTALIVGSLLFGIGWGLAGLCPGPAIVLLPTGGAQALVFCLAMLSGMAWHRHRFTRPMVPA